jgi:hypothetical protein
MHWESLVAVAVICALPILMRELVVALIGGAVLAASLGSKRQHAAPAPSDQPATDDEAASGEHRDEACEERASERSTEHAGGRSTERAREPSKRPGGVAPNDRREPGARSSDEEQAPADKSAARPT